MGNSNARTTERRQHPRQRLPQLYARIDGRVYRTVEWSFGGLVIEDPDSYLSAGALLRIDGLIDEDAYREACAPCPVDIRARVLRVGPAAGVVALSCLKLDDAAYAVLSEIRDGISIPMATPAE